MENTTLLDVTFNGAEDILGSPSSTSSDNDAVNSSAARVYFGPFQSPEKKFVPPRRTLIPPLSSSPVRRSPRLSQLVCQSIGAAAENSEHDGSGGGLEELNEVDSDQPRASTPENDVLLPDEPSSLLASKIMRAHDNPSPPPQLSVYGVSGTSSPFADRQFPLIDISSPNAHHNFDLLERLKAHREFEEQAPLSPRHDFSLPASHTRHSPRTFDTGCTSPPDLISFESLSTASARSVKQSYDADVTDAFVAAVSTGGSLHAEEICYQHSVPSQSIAAEEHGLANTDAQTSGNSLEKIFQTVSLVIPQQATEASILQKENLPSTSDSVTCPACGPPVTSPRRSTRRSRTPQISEGDQNSPSFQSPSKNNVRPSPSSLRPSSVQTLGEHTTSRDRSHDGAAEVITDEEATNDQPSMTLEWRRNLKANESSEAERGLRSLSPDAVESLACLVPSSSDPASARIMSQNPDITADSLAGQLHPATPLRQTRLSNTDPQSLPIPQSPSTNPSPPFKLSLASDDTIRTPARRVPIQTVIKHGLPSAQKAASSSLRYSHLNNQSGPHRPFIFPKPALDDVPRSPAKRPAITTPASLNTHVSQSPSRLFPRARSTSVEPKLSAICLPIRGRSMEPSSGVSKEASSVLSPTQESSSDLKPSSKSLFPLGTYQTLRHHLPSSIPEESEIASTHVSDDHLIQNSAPAKQPLRQLSARSRIPRIGTQSYARPIRTHESDVKVEESVNVGLTRRDGFSARVPASAAHGEVTLPAASVSKAVNAGNAESSTPQSRKRKRTGNDLLSPTARPYERKIVQGGRQFSQLNPKPALHMQLANETGPATHSRPIRMRKVVDGMLIKRAEDLTRQPVASDPHGEKEIVERRSAEPTTLEPLQVSSQVEQSVLRDTFADNAFLSAATLLIEDSSLPPELTEVLNVEAATNDTQPSSTSRRKSRTHKPVHSSTDVFGTVVRPLQPRKRGSAARSEADGFKAMSAVALKALTSSNTAKNQQIFVQLETEVVHRDGVRPESPTMKVRTIMQKQREEKDRQRQMRAERRSRRIQDGHPDDIDQINDHGDQSLTLSDTDMDVSHEQLGKHRLGPGDEEDYETPEKLERPTKRLRVVNDDAEGKRDKRVKWDRGLFSTIYLDEIPSKARPRLDPPSALRGCLSATSKALPLDTLGNIINLDTPLDLVQENVVVKKFVYDNDTEPEVALVKMTRSKSKKAKS